MTFQEEIEAAINRRSLENESNTPDFILAEFLTSCLRAFNQATNARTRWYGEPGSTPGSIPVAPSSVKP